MTNFGYQPPAPAFGDALNLPVHIDGRIEIDGVEYAPRVEIDGRGYGFVVRIGGDYMGTLATGAQAYLFAVNTVVARASK